MRCYSPVPTFGHALEPSEVGRHTSAAWTIALVDDGLDPPFVEELHRLLNERADGAAVRLWKKPSGTSPSPKELIEEVVGAANAGVVGIGL